MFTQRRNKLCMKIIFILFKLSFDSESTDSIRFRRIRPVTMLLNHLIYLLHKTDAIFILALGKLWDKKFIIYVYDASLQ